MQSERVLICGAGVAGSVCAFWLAKSNYQVVVVERSKAEQKAGQGIEIEEPALQVVRSMGILDKLNERKTGEMGVSIEDEHARQCGLFGVGGLSVTGALELMRGDLTEVLYKAADESPNVTYHFETTIQSMRQTQDKVIVDLEHRNHKATRTEEFDLVIGADGVKSRTRQLAFGSPEKLDCFKRIGAFVAYFSIPKEERDWPYSRICNFPDRRLVWTRPISKDSDMTSVYLIYAHSDVPSLREANAAGDRVKQKEAFAEIYNGLGWETPRVIRKMMAAENFYSDELVQVKLKKWSQDRVVLVGDAAWAPTPMTGEGNQLAIIGAWVLAQELSRNRGPAAFEMYEKRFRAYVENAQNIPLGGYAPFLFNPQTAWGIWTLQTIVSLVARTIQIIAWTNVAKILPSWSDDKHPRFDLEAEKGEAESSQ
ncbi:Kynurenine 3-monooxygenase [Elsinoe australis]|uniref:Kynurenine 3-monooxygenase n=1 Tax=Elsinoe australis TaxID=40998 RepID=A0A2P7YJH5_9PEZI|nr:Kynurenine 3-monooxygenase [Elsinoe australis]